MPDLIDILLFRGGFNTSVVLAGTTLLGAACGLIGLFTVLRGRAMISDALGHATLPGVAGAFLLAGALGLSGRSLPALLAGAAVGGMLGVLAVRVLTATDRLRGDAGIAIVLSTFFGLGIVLLSVAQRSPGGQQGGLHHFIYGQTAAMSIGDVVLAGSMALGAALLAGLFFKELRLLCFDEAFAAVGGWPVRTLDAGLMLMTTLAVVAGLQAVGMLLIIALLIIPAAAARFWTDRLTPMAWISAALGGASGYAGSALSAWSPDTPAGAVIVLCAGALFTLSLLLAPGRGAASVAWRTLAMRRRVAGDHLLRAMLERESAPDGHDPEHIRRALGWGPVLSAVVLRDATRRGLIARAPAGWSLTDAGRRAGACVLETRRAWERYMLEAGERAPWNVGVAPDLAEHERDPSLVAEIERELAARQHPPTRAGEGPR